VQDFNDITRMGNPSGDVGRIFLGCGREVSVDEFAFAAHGESEPFDLIYISALDDQIKPTRAKGRPGQSVRNIADRNDSASPQQHSIKFLGAMWESEKSRGSHEFGDVASGYGKAPLSQAEKNERGRVRLGAHWGRSIETEWLDG
jgi:hypothetical protein